MFKNVVLLSVKLAMTAAHSHTTSTDAIWTDDDDTLTKLKSRGSSLTFGHRSHPQHPRRSALTTAPHAWSKLPLRSTLALMPRAAVAAWYGYTTTPRIQIASKAARLSCVAAHVTHVKTGEKELHGSAGKQSGAVRGPLCLLG